MSRDIRVTAEQAEAAVEQAWPDAVAMVARTVGLITRSPEPFAERFAQATVLTLAADDSKVADEWATERLLWLATDVVPGLLDDLREARRMAASMDVEGFADFLAGATAWPPAPVRVLRGLAALRRDLADVLHDRARHLGRTDPLIFDQEGSTQ